MKVAIQHSLPHDEFVKRFGPIVGGSYDEAHAALLRAQGIKPVVVETEYAPDGSVEAVAPIALPVVVSEPRAISGPGEQQATVDLGPLYGIFIQLADAMAAMRAEFDAKLIAQERRLQEIMQRVDDNSVWINYILENGTARDGKNLKQGTG